MIGSVSTSQEILSANALNTENAEKTDGAGSAAAIQVEAQTAAEWTANGNASILKDNNVKSTLISGQIEEETSEEASASAAEKSAVGEQPLKVAEEATVAENAPEEAEAKADTGNTEGGKVQLSAGAGGSTEEDEDEEVTKTIFMPDGSVIQKTTITDASGNITTRTTVISSPKEDAQQPVSNTADDRSEYGQR